MTTAEIQVFIDSNKIDELKSALDTINKARFIKQSFKAAGVIVDGAHTKIDANQYNPKKHEVHNPTTRPDKVIRSDSGSERAIVSVSRLSIPAQKQIVRMAASFLGSPTMACTPKNDAETKMFEMVKLVSDQNKLEYKFRDISKTTMSERECAELWYTQDADPDYWAGTAIEGAKFKLRMRVLSSSRGDSLYPVFDSMDDMIAFCRYYEISELNDSGNTEKIYRFDIYTAEKFYFFQKAENSTGWSEVKTKSNGSTEANTVSGIPNITRKIPVVYYYQPTTEWDDVQEMIDRLEKKISNHADTNDYFDSPIVFAEGEVEGFSDKGEQGKVLQGKNGAKVEYLSWDSAPESMKMEIENLMKFIHSYTQTPDISFESMKGIGNNLSGFALKMLFMDAHLKASDKEDMFGECVQRRINYIKAALVKLSVKLKGGERAIISPEFKYFLPKDVESEVATLVKAYEAGIISRETAVKLNPLVSEPIKEIELINADDTRKAATTK